MECKKSGGGKNSTGMKCSKYDNFVKMRCKRQSTLVVKKRFADIENDCYSNYSSFADDSRSPSSFSCLMRLRICCCWLR
jgi:hypothetical protein